MKLGQHFLINNSVAKKIVAALEIKSNDVVIEIGAGHGELTAYLNNESQIMNRAVKIIAIEKDKKLISQLQRKFAAGKNIKIIEGDILKILQDLCSRFHASCFKIVGNIPYYLTGYLLRLVSELKQKPELCVFTVQKEVAERIAAQPPRMNKIAASVQFWAEPMIIGIVSKKDFQPAPKVDSAIIKFIPKNKITTVISQLCLNHSKKGIGNVDMIENLQNSYYRTINILFRQPRKTILNNLRMADGPAGAKTASFTKGVSATKAELADKPAGKKSQISKNEIFKKLAEIGINPQDRPQNLSVGDIVKIANCFINELKS
jgi:16S rRNA (adenine1518-N6/adenine1519-N6)-dimethyltransferase